MNIFNFLKHNNNKPDIKFPGGLLEVNKWVISKFIGKVLNPVVGVNPFPYDEQVLMVASVCWIKPDYIFEWGTHFGKSARVFYETTKTFKIKSKIVSIDLPDNIAHVEHPGKKRGMYIKKFKKVMLIQGDGLEESVKFLEDLEKSKKVLFFLDGDHSYQSVRRELKKIAEVRPSASILIHDTFYQVKTSGYNIGPHKALMEFLKRNKNYHTYSTQLGLPGMTLLLSKK